MVRLDEAEARHEVLRERDRTVASMQSKQRMLSVFTHLFDEPAREAIDKRLHEALTKLRAQARALALELGRAAFLAVDVEDLGRVGAGMRRLEQHLDENPSEALDVCHDLIMFLRELGELDLSNGPRPAPVEFD